MKRKIRYLIMEKSFNQIFQNKGTIAPIAEKACRNFDLKSKSSVIVQERLHYFAIGHAFKNIDGKNVFGYQLDKEKKKEVPTRFLALQRSFFNFQEDFKKLIGDIRNINCHYVHSFEKIELKVVNGRITQLLIDSFELAATYSYLNEKELSYEDFLNSENSDKKLVHFLRDKFYPNEEHQQEERITFSAKTKMEAIEHLLFINVTADFDWKLFDQHIVFKIAAGKYLSFYACLFMLAMFLYKGEANQLISKIKGFKRNDDNKYRSKRNIFTFFSKKFSSQDINSEEQHLVKFRDLIQYLNHYPTIWNEEIKLQPQFPVMTNQLKKYIIESEIDRSFPDYAGNERFLLFATQKLFMVGDNKVSFSDEERKKFSSEINSNPERLEVLKRKTYLSEKEKIEKAKLERTEKLLNRIVKNLLFISYGRNQDKFMDFAVRFLAENHYFGKNARFKMYQFYTIDEQEEYLIRQKKILSKKDFDKLKYHQGRLEHYDTYNNHLSNYPEWDTPFVIENNAIQVITTLDNDVERIISVQRNLMLYLLEDALYAPEKENSGKHLISQYFNHHQEEFKASKTVLEQSQSITKKQKSVFGKLLPARLLHGYLPADKNNAQEFTALQLILEKVKQEEKRYEQLLEEAKKHKAEEDFLKRNKGKQFKLRFVRKAWHLMYFREMYLKQTEACGGHHKRFHITKEEFNDFSRWMFAFEEVPQYKDYLFGLFNEKGFLENPDFKALFEKEKSLNGLYEKTKVRFDSWLHINNQPQQREDKYHLAKYQPFFESKILYINISHFIEYIESINKLKRNEQGIIEYNALANISYLIGDYYYKDKLNPDEYKPCAKLYNKLKTVKLEDALLYEMALFYLNIDKSIVQRTRANVKSILTGDVTIDIKDVNNNHLYNLIIPFNKIDSFVGLINHKSEQEQSRLKSSFLGNIKDYLEMVKYDRDIMNIYTCYSKSKVLKYEDLNAINSHIIAKSAMFTKVALKLEEYFIVKDKIGIKKDNRITYEEINHCKKYFDLVTRNKAFHFGIPQKSYDKLIKEIETEFIRNEIKPANPDFFENMSKGQQSVCVSLLETSHRNLFNRNDKKEERISNARKKYFDKAIKNKKQVH